MFGSVRESLRNRDYKSNSSAYKKYAKHVGKLVANETYCGKSVDGANENGFKLLIYMIAAVVPQRHYLNRFAFKLVAVGEHNDCEYGCRTVLNDLNRNAHYQSTDIKAIYGWRFL